MTLTERINSLATWGDKLRSLTQLEKQTTFERAHAENAWFTPANCETAFQAIAQWLTVPKLTTWAAPYSLANVFTEKRIGLVMAGNIPLVGFHDFLAVLLSGHHATVKLSSQDKVLIIWVAQHLTDINPKWASQFNFTESLLGPVDAAIATGSDNSARYFEYYFKSKPHIIRKNRTSVAILTSSTTDSELQSLGADVFNYFGLGCRNVSKLFVPDTFDLTRLQAAWQSFAWVGHHHKFANNYDYQRAIRLISNKPFIDFGFFLMEESTELVSPISVLYFARYSDFEQLENMLEKFEAKIQCCVALGAPNIAFGQAQSPSLTDYADGIDVLQFLSEEI